MPVTIEEYKGGTMTLSFSPLPNELQDKSFIKNLMMLNGLGPQVGYWEIDQKTNQVLAGPQFLRIISPLTSSDQLFDLLPSTQRVKLEEALQLLNTKHIPFDVDLRLEIGAKKRHFRIIGKIGEDHAGGKLPCGMLKDITHEEIKDVSARNHNLELNAYDRGLEQFSIVARTDRFGKITYANEQFCKLSKYTQEELIGQDHRIINSGFHPKEFFKKMWDTVNEGKNWRGVIRNKAKDGSFYWVDTVIIPIKDNAGEIVELLSFRFDITAFMQQKAELEQLRKENAELKKQLTQANLYSHAYGK